MEWNDFGLIRNQLNRRLIMSKFWIQPLIFIRNIYIVKKESLFRRIIKMSLERKEVHDGQPGYYAKNQIRYRFCNDFHDEGLRCTRVANHKGPHAAHVVMGVKDSTEIWRNPATGEDEVRVKPGMKNTEDVQIATW